ncbi:hypothetical protein GE09DRAFT_1211055 [Coniochaeta sp. 2T2.1]|nr:hypothetical protein GE09DRAFT_1211055 [Coniochaeta sp. 2T2.1]
MAGCKCRRCDAFVRMVDLTNRNGDIPDNVTMADLDALAAAFKDQPVMSGALNAESSASGSPGSSTTPAGDGNSSTNPSDSCVYIIGDGVHPLSWSDSTDPEGCGWTLSPPGWSTRPLGAMVSTPRSGHLSVSPWPRRQTPSRPSLSAPAKPVNATPYPWTPRHDPADGDFTHIKGAFSTCPIPVGMLPYVNKYVAKHGVKLNEQVQFIKMSEEEGVGGPGKGVADVLGAFGAYLREGYLRNKQQ